MFAIAQTNRKQIHITNHTNLALKAFTRRLSEQYDDAEDENHDNSEDKITVRRKESRAVSWARFLDGFEEEVDPSNPRRMNSCSFEKLPGGNDPLPSAREKLWKSFTTVTDVKKLKSSFANASNAIYTALSSLAARDRNSQKSLEEKIKWLIDDDMEQFREIKKEMRKRKLVTHSAIKENLEDIINLRMDALMIRNMETEIHL